jgi:hypothetical protein
MEEKHLRKLKIRRGNDNQRKVTLFEEGEPVFIKDAERVYIGDDNTVGGIRVSNKNYITSDSNRPSGSEEDDIFVNETNKSGFIIENNSSIIQIFPSIVDTCEKIKNNIDDIDALLKRLSAECCNPAFFLATDLDTESFSDNILMDNGDTIKVKEYKP